MNINFIRHTVLGIQMDTLSVSSHLPNGRISLKLVGNPLVLIVFFIKLNTLY